jgi:single-strand DNA-binding protein
MSLNLNKVHLAGRLTRPPELKPVGASTCATFGLAINRRWKDQQGNPKEDTIFIDVEAWGRTAELVAQYLTKGSGCYLEGRLRLQQWDDKVTGAKRSKLSVVADSIQFTDARPASGAAPDPVPSENDDIIHRATAPAPRPSAPLDDEPPF